MWLLAIRFVTCVVVLAVLDGAHAQTTPSSSEPEWWLAGNVPEGPDPHASRLEQPELGAEDPPFGFSRREGFRLRSKDGNFVLRIGLLAAFQLEPAWTNGKSRTNDAFPFLRPYLAGNFFKPWIRYLVAMELARPTPFLLVALVDIQPWPELAIRFGQQPTPVSRHEMLFPHQLFFPDYASTSTFFWSGRARGITLFGTLFGESLDYFVGAFSGTPLGRPVDVSENYVIEGRVTANPMGTINPTELPFTPTGGPLPLRVSFTVQGYYGKLQTAAESYNVSDGVRLSAVSVNTDRVGTASGDAWFQWGPAILFGEFYWRRIRPLGDVPSFTSLGAWGQAMLDVYRRILGVGARVNWIEPNTDVANNEAYESEAQLAYFIFPPALVLKLRYAWIRQLTPSTPEALATLPFAAGRSNLVTLQLTLAL